MKTKYMQAKENADQAYRKWYGRKPGIESMIWWLAYKHWKNKVDT
jgi:hypothetical protein